MENKKLNTDSPFEIQGLKSNTFTTKNKEVDVVSSGDKIFSLQEIGKRITYMKDTLEYVKLYKNSFTVLKDLSSAGLRAFLYVLEVLEPKHSEVHIYPQAAMEWMGYKSLKSVYQGIHELTSLNIIVPIPDKQNYYFININYFYNGKRI